MLNLPCFVSNFYCINYEDIKSTIAFKLIPVIISLVLQSLSILSFGLKLLPLKPRYACFCVEFVIYSYGPGNLSISGISCIQSPRYSSSIICSFSSALRNFLHTQNYYLRFSHVTILFLTFKTYLFNLQHFQLRNRLIDHAGVNSARKC